MISVGSPMCSGNKLAADPLALMLNKVLLFLTNAFKGVQENLNIHLQTV